MIVVSKKYKATKMLCLHVRARPMAICTHVSQTWVVTHHTVQAWLHSSLSP